MGDAIQERQPGGWRATLIWIVCALVTAVQSVTVPLSEPGDVRLINVSIPVSSVPGVFMTDDLNWVSYQGLVLEAAASPKGCREYSSILLSRSGDSSSRYSSVSAALCPSKPKSGIIDAISVQSLQFDEQADPQVALNYPSFLLLKDIKGLSGEITAVQVSPISEASVLLFATGESVNKPQVAVVDISTSGVVFTKTLTLTAPPSDLFKPQYKRSVCWDPVSEAFRNVAVWYYRPDTFEVTGGPRAFSLVVLNSSSQYTEVALSLDNLVPPNSTLLDVDIVGCAKTDDSISCTWTVLTIDTNQQVALSGCLVKEVSKDTLVVFSIESCAVVRQWSLTSGQNEKLSTWGLISNQGATSLLLVTNLGKLSFLGITPDNSRTGQVILTPKFDVWTSPLSTNLIANYKRGRLLTSEAVSMTFETPTEAKTLSIQSMASPTVRTTLSWSDFSDSVVSHLWADYLLLQGSGNAGAVTLRKISANSENNTALLTGGANTAENNVQIGYIFGNGSSGYLQKAAITSPVTPDYNQLGWQTAFRKITKDIAVDMVEGQKEQLLSAQVEQFDGCIVNILSGTGAKNPPEFYRRTQWIVQYSWRIPANDVLPTDYLTLIDDTTIAKFSGNNLTFYSLTGDLSQTTVILPFTTGFVLGHQLLGSTFAFGFSIAGSPDCFIGQVNLMKNNTKDISPTHFVWTVQENLSAYLAAFYTLGTKNYWMLGAQTGTAVIFVVEGRDIKRFSTNSTSTRSTNFKIAQQPLYVCPIEGVFDFRDGMIAVDIVSKCTGTVSSLITVKLDATESFLMVTQDYIYDNVPLIDACSFRDYTYFMERETNMVFISNRSDNYHSRAAVNLTALGYPTFTWFDCNIDNQIVIIPGINNITNTTDLLVMDSSWDGQLKLTTRIKLVGTVPGKVTLIRSVSRGSEIYLTLKVVEFGSTPASPKYVFFKFTHGARDLFRIKGLPNSTASSAAFSIPGLTSQNLTGSLLLSRSADENTLAVKPAAPASKIQLRTGSFPYSSLLSISGTYSTSQSVNNGLPKGMQVSVLQRTQAELPSTLQVVGLDRYWDYGRRILLPAGFGGNATSGNQSMILADNTESRIIGWPSGTPSTLGVSNPLCLDYAQSNSGDSYFLSFNMTLGQVTTTKPAPTSTWSFIVNPDIARFIKSCKLYFNETAPSGIKIAAIARDNTLRLFAGQIISSSRITLSHDPGRLPFSNSSISLGTLPPQIGSNSLGAAVGSKHHQSVRRSFDQPKHCVTDSDRVRLQTKVCLGERNAVLPNYNSLG